MIFYKGKTSTTLEKGTSAALVVNMDNQDFDGNALQIRVVQVYNPCRAPKKHCIEYTQN